MMSNDHLQPSAIPTVKQRPETLLLICFFDPWGIATVPENVAWFQRLSKFPLVVMNLFECRRPDGSLGLPSTINFDAFAGVVIHNSISYDVDNLRRLDIDVSRPLAQYEGVKVLMKQDENHRFREMARYIGETGFDLVLTCLPDEAVDAVYPPSIVGDVRFSRMLTGYVTPALRSIADRTDRTIDIGYRGSIQPLGFGRLAYEKRKIGSDVKRLLEDTELNLDISSRWEDRFGSGAWIAFLSNCKATLGVESGASVFGIESDLADRTREIERDLGPQRDEEGYSEAFLARLSDLESDVYYNQVSPRHFEAAATRTLQIMFPGRYSNIFIAGRHFVQLERDYSNIQSVVDFLRNDQLRRQMVERAHEEIIGNPEYWIETFVSQVDALLLELLGKKNRSIKVRFRSDKAAKQVLLICAHKPSLDPRLDWISRYAPDGIDIVQVGVLQPGSSDPTIQVLPDGRLVLAEPRERFEDSALPKWHRKAGNDPSGWMGLSELQRCSFLHSLSDDSLAGEIGAFAGTERLHQFRWYLGYLLDTSMALIRQAEVLRTASAVIATDLDTLPAALVIKGMFGIPVLYDAHEYWPEADVSAASFERRYWEQMERRLTRFTDHCQTVSPGLATLMSQAYGVQFQVVPNCEPITLESSTPPPERACPGDRIEFLFQGNFAPKRGIDLLINAWSRTDSRAVLVLRGPDNEYKREMLALAEASGLLGDRIRFDSSVAEGELVTAARNSHVGVIPYTPFGANYTHCCPNKTSQYMAAGLPLLANSTCFLQEIIQDSSAGISIDFSREDRLVEAVNVLTADGTLRATMADNARSYFVDFFNWQSRSRSMYEKIVDLTRDSHPSNLCVYEFSESKPIFLTDRPDEADIDAKSDVVDVAGVCAPDVPSPTESNRTTEPKNESNQNTESISTLRRIVGRMLQRVWHTLPNPARRLIMPVARPIASRIRVEHNIDSDYQKPLE